MPDVTDVADKGLGQTSVTVPEIVISGGTVTAKAGAETIGSDIGNATSSKGNSTGTTTMNSVTVTGGSIAPGTTLTNPSNGVNSNLHSLSVPGNWTAGEEVSIAGLGDYGTDDIFADENGNVYLFVPEGTYVFNADGRLFEATVDGGAGVQDNSGKGVGTQLDSALDNDGSITGGNGGAGADSASDIGGAGSNGGAGVDGYLNSNQGEVSGGDAGDGGCSSKVSGGAGGDGGTGVMGDVAENDGVISGGGAGDGGMGIVPGHGGTGGAASTGTIGGGTGTTDAGDSGASGASIDQHGGVSWLDGSSLRMTAISQDGSNMSLAFSVPLQAGLDFENWVQRSVESGKLAVVEAESLAAMVNADLATVLNGGTAEGVSLVYVGTAACSSSAAEYVSSDATAKTMTIRVPKPSQAAGFYRVCVVGD